MKEQHEQQARMMSIGAMLSMEGKAPPKVVAKDWQTHEGLQLGQGSLGVLGLSGEHPEAMMPISVPTTHC